MSGEPKNLDDALGRAHLTMSQFGTKADLLQARLWAADAKLAKAVEALEKLRKSAALLQQNAEGCAVNHYGDDFHIHGMPCWLTDTAADIAAVARFSQN